MNREGLRVPVIAIPTSPREDCFHLRAGFRRTTAARKLGWKKIPAIVLPPDTPLIEEYWTNILENSARSRLTTYETALAAKTMRDQFGVRGSEFAARAGYSSTYIGNLLRCMDNLPPEILDVWRDRAPIPIDMYVKWSQFTHDEAVKLMLAHCGRSPKSSKEWRPPPEIKERYCPPKLASARGQARMQKIRFAVEVATSLDDRSRTLALAIVDCCSGAREDVPDVYQPGRKIRTTKPTKKPGANASRPCDASTHETKVVQPDDRSSDSPQEP